MFLDANHGKNADGQSGTAAYVAAAAGNLLRGNAVVSTVEGDGMDWGALLVRVRDGQDRAAFAVLFRHFAHGSRRS